MPASTLDLATITADLLAGLQSAVAASPLLVQDPFDIVLTGAIPERKDGGSGCQLSLYLLLFDQQQMATPAPSGAGSRRMASPPVLALSYLLSAMANDDYRQEQKALSIAAQYFTDHPVHTLPATAGQLSTQYRIVKEQKTTSELAQIWQALAAPMRASGIYTVTALTTSPRTGFLSRLLGS
jgi:hypothetical protein